MTNRDYSGGARVISLATAIGSTGTSFEVDQVLGTWPTGSADGSLPFFVVLSRGTPQEEKVLIRNRAGTTFTVVAGGRGVDDTPASAHGIGATVEHVWTGTDAREANHHVNATRGVHGLAASDEVVGQAEFAAALEAERLARIADVDAEQAAREAAILAEQTARADADAAIIASLAQSAPVGAMFIWPAETAPAGWFVCRGQSIARATYPELFALIGTTYGSVDGASFNLPNLSRRVPRGKLAGDAMGDTGGAESVDLTDAMVPLRSHSHAITHDHLGRQSPRSGSGTAQLIRPANASESDASDTTVAASNGAHTHNVPIPQFSGFTADTGGGSPVDITPAHTLVGFIIKT